MDAIWMMDERDGALPLHSTLCILFTVQEMVELVTTKRLLFPEQPGMVAHSFVVGQDDEDLNRIAGLIRAQIFTNQAGAPPVEIRTGFDPGQTGNPRRDN